MNGYELWLNQKIKAEQTRIDTWINKPEGQFKRRFLDDHQKKQHELKIAFAKYLEYQLEVLNAKSP